MTWVPDVWKDDKFSYADCPGFLDNRGAEINIANAVNIKTTIHRARSVRVVVLINYHSLRADRGRGVRDLAQILTDLFGDSETLLEHAPSIRLGVSHVPKQDGDGDPIELPNIRHLVNDTTGMSEDVRMCVNELCERIFLYHPSDDGNPSWLKRDTIVKSIQELEGIKDPRSIFRTVLTVEDEKVREGDAGAMQTYKRRDHTTVRVQLSHLNSTDLVVLSAATPRQPMPHHAPLQRLREIVSGLSQRVAEAMDNTLFSGAAEALRQMDRLARIDNIVVERLLDDSKRQVRASPDGVSAVASPCRGCCCRLTRSERRAASAAIVPPPSPPGRLTIITPPG